MASPAPPDVESPAKSSKSKKEAEQERRLAEAKKHVKELESQVLRLPLRPPPLPLFCVISSGFPVS